MPVSMPAPSPGLYAREVRIPARAVELEGRLEMPAAATAVVVFVHGSGSSRHSPRNRHVARQLHAWGLGTLLFDLLTAEEEAVDDVTAQLRFDVQLLAGRLSDATAWLRAQDEGRAARIGYFGASTGAAAALIAAAERGREVGAVVSRGGRPDLAAQALERVDTPTLLIVGGADTPVIELNRQAWARLRAEKELVVVPGATHLFEEPGTLDEVARLAAAWFRRHLMPEATT